MGGKKAHPHARSWYWQEGDPLGVFKGLDWPAVRRGRQVYTEVFAPCHALEALTFNHLQAFMTKEEIKKLASTYEIVDKDPDDEGNPFVRPGKATDELPVPYPNQKAAQFANNGAKPPPLRTIVFAREEGPDYVFALLTGYHWAEMLPIPPFVGDKGELKPGQFFNPYFKGGVLSMPPPLSDGMIDYIDGTPATCSQMAKDVVHFLRWSAEPEFDERRIFFWKAATTTGLLYVLAHHYSQKMHNWLYFKRSNYRWWAKKGFHY
jgi:ubiquinol-cytochrome c reductase cytochrome c1 subunit